MCFTRSHFRLGLSGVDCCCVLARVLVTGREIRLPTGNRVSRAPPVNVLTGQKIPRYFENFEFERQELDKYFCILTVLHAGGRSAVVPTLCGLARSWVRVPPSSSYFLSTYSLVQDLIHIIMKKNG